MCVDVHIHVRVCVHAPKGLLKDFAFQKYFNILLFLQDLLGGQLTSGLQTQSKDYAHFAGVFTALSWCVWRAHQLLCNSLDVTDKIHKVNKFFCIHIANPKCENFPVQSPHDIQACSVILQIYSGIKVRNLWYASVICIKQFCLHTLQVQVVHLIKTRPKLWRTPTKSALGFPVLILALSVTKASPSDTSTHPDAACSVYAYRR